jgi:ankyrin repeat protein
MVQTLLDAGADKNASNNDGHTALHMAANRGALFSLIWHLAGQLRASNAHWPSLIACPAHIQVSEVMFKTAATTHPPILLHTIDLNPMLVLFLQAM